MGINVKLQDEFGAVEETVLDEKNLLYNLLPREDHSLLSGVDWYGNTIFNGLQMDQFLSEWKELKKKEITAEQARHLEAIEQLALKCKSGVHLYLKFIGD